jgi:hypothetical protein
MAGTRATSAIANAHLKVWPKAVATGPPTCPRSPEVSGASSPSAPPLVLPARQGAPARERSVLLGEIVTLDRASGLPYVSALGPPEDRLGHRGMARPRHASQSPPA